MLCTLLFTLTISSEISSTSDHDFRLQRTALDPFGPFRANGYSDHTYINILIKIFIGTKAKRHSYHKPYTKKGNETKVDCVAHSHLICNDDETEWETQKVGFFNYLLFLLINNYQKVIIHSSPMQYTPKDSIDR